MSLRIDSTDKNDARCLNDEEQAAGFLCVRMMDYWPTVKVARRTNMPSKYNSTL